MKNFIPAFLRFFICAFFLLSGNVMSFAQGNYACLPHPGTINWFINNENYLRGIRVDSVFVNGTDTIYYPSSATWLKTGSWLGKRVVQKADGTFLFDNADGDTVIIKTQANIGDTWTLYDDTGSKYYTATITSVDTMTISGVIDSIKTVRINTYDPSPDTSDFFDNKFISISKAHGFVRVLDLYDFPEPSRLSSYFFDLIPFHIPTRKELYDYYAGDAFEYNTSSYCVCGNGSNVSGLEYDSVLSRTDIDSIHTQLTVYKINTGYDHFCSYPDTLLRYQAVKWTDTILLDNSPAFSISPLPEGNYQELSYFYYPSDSTNCIKGPLITATVLHIFEGCDVTITYKNGLGMLDTVSCVPPCPDAIGYSSRTETTQIYAHKGLIQCGTFKSLEVKNVNKSMTVLSIAPNPAADVATINISGSQWRKYIVTNTVGQVMKTVYSNKSVISFDVSTWLPGLYLVGIVSSDGSKENAKLIVVH